MHFHRLSIYIAKKKKRCVQGTSYQDLSTHRSRAATHTKIDSKLTYVSILSNMNSFLCCISSDYALSTCVDIDFIINLLELFQPSPDD
jgi:hypothetical protein